MLDATQLIILEAADEDYHGLWELAWAVRTKSPEMSEAHAREAAMLETRYLFEKGLISLVVTNDLLAPLCELDRANAVRVLSDVAFWDEPASRGPRYAIGATDEGMRVYESSKHAP